MNQKILIVDDQKTALKVIEKVLGGLSGIEIIQSHNYDEALAATRDNNFALAIIDVIMPGKNGYELAKSIHEQGKNRKLPIIFISSSYSEEENVIEGYKAGGVDFLTKPINPVIMLSKVNTFLLLDSYSKELENKVNDRTLELENALQHWQETFDAIDDYISIVDSNHEIIKANKAMLDVYGNDIIGKKCYQVMHPEKQIPSMCPLVTSINDGMPHSEIIEEGDKTFDVSSYPFNISSDSQPQFIHIARDVTERVNIEDRLRQGEKMQAIGQLAGGVAHDFNNQLTAIRGYAILLKDKVAGDEKLEGFTDIIISATKRSEDLTQKLLAFSRKGIVQKTSNDTHKLIEEALSIVNRTINKKVKVELNLNASDTMIDCDPSQIENAFLNIIINANDAMPDGGTITVSTVGFYLENSSDYPGENHINPGKYINIKIRDTGTGIPQELLSRIYEPFFSTKGNQGTGLGLAAVFGTVQSHNGNIEVDSSESGTEFSILLPVHENQNRVGEETEFSILDAKDRHLDEQTILLVDDEPMVRNYAEEILTSLGYNVIACSNGMEAVEVFKERWKEFCLVIMDMMMPEMNGEETFDEMMKINPDVKVIFISGFNDIERDKFNQESVLFLNKPFEVKDLSDALGKFLD